ncbi:MAG: hypothetical protein WC758_01785 [Candidatus Woesearchaeota archaeon]|jgi:hypothetical protein
MDEILILGPSSDGDSKKIQVYESIATVCLKYVPRVYSPLDSAKFIGDDTQRYERADQRVGLADLIIGEQSGPSTGEGIEIGLAIPLKIPLIVVAQTGSKVSGITKGCPILKEILYYDSIQDLEQKLSTSIEKYI